MAFSTTSFMAGVGTMFAAITIGFAGGAMLTTSPKEAPNRLERVTANAPVAASVSSPALIVPAKPDVPVVPVTAQTGTEAPATPPAREIALSPAAVAPSPASVPEAIAQPQTSGRDVATAQIEAMKKAREAELKREKERQIAARQERRKRQEIQAAANAVRQMQRDGVLQVSQRDSSPRLGFFGED